MDHRRRAIEREEGPPTSGQQSASNYEEGDEDDANSIGSQTEDSCSASSSSSTFKASGRPFELANGALRQHIEPLASSIKLEQDSDEGQYSSAQQQQQTLAHDRISPRNVAGIEMSGQQATFERLACDERQQLADMSQSLEMKARQACNRAAGEQKLGGGRQPPSNQNNECEEVKHVDLFGVKIVALIINGKERLCLAQISNTLLKEFSYNEIHNRRVALGITCVQCTPIQLEMLRRAGAMPSSSRRCGMITMREAERLCRSFLAEEQPPELPEHFYFTVAHRVNYGCKGRFIPSRYISSRAKCIECFHCGEFYSPNKFIFHSHKQPDATDCNPPDSPNINSWRKHINLDWSLEHSQEIKYAWEDVKSLFNGGTRRRASVSAAAASAATGTGTGSGASGSQVGALQSAQSGDNRGQFQDRNDELEEDNKATSKRRKITHNIEDLSAPAEFDARPPGSLASARAPQRGAMLSSAHSLSQSERRKLPMGWPGGQQTASNSPAAHRSQHVAPAGNQQAARMGSRPPRATANALNIPPRRMSPCNPADRDPNKRLLTTTNWHQPRLNATTERHHRQPQPQQHQQAPFESQSDRLASHFNHCSDLYGEKRADHHSQSQSILTHQKRQSSSQLSDELLQATSDISMGKLMGQAPMSCAAGGQATTSLQQPALDQAAKPSTFIYSQLYSQLLQSQLQQQQTRQAQTPALLPMEAQLALRHHIWSSLLANLRCNPAALEVTARGDGNPAIGQQPANHSNYNIGNNAQQSRTGGSLLASFNQPLGADPANLSMSAHLAPSGFNPLSSMMQSMYGAPNTGQVALGDPSTAAMFTLNESANDGCK